MKYVDNRYFMPQTVQILKKSSKVNIYLNANPKMQGSLCQYYGSYLSNPQNSYQNI